MTKKKRVKEKVAASMFVYKASNMTKKGRKEIANWLRDRANDLEELGEEFSDTFRARYYYA